MKRKLTYLLLSISVVAVLLLLRGQTAVSTVPFATTPFIAGMSSSGVSLLVRQGDSTYSLLGFGIGAPYNLFTSMASLSTIISTGAQALAAMPAAPPNVGISSQVAALADFTGNGTPGVAYFEIARNPSSIDVYQGTSSFLFSSHNSYNVGPNVTGVIAADFNRDGKPDLAVSFGGGPGNGGVAILLNNGDGTFANAVYYAPTTSASSISVLDINHDGFLDIAVASESTTVTNGIAILLGKGDGTFTSGATYSIGSPAALTLVDLNGDGNPDIAATLINNSLVVLLGKGDGTFTTGATYPTGAAPFYLAAGDLNGDGKNDVVVANAGGQTVTVYLGNGNGTLTQGASYVVSYDPQWLVLTDENHDGKRDIVSGIGDQHGIGPSYNSTNIDILLGNGDGTFQGAPTYPTTGQSSNLLVTADFNGDGKLDAITNDQFAGKLFLFNGNGNGTFQPPVTTSSLESNGQTGPSSAVASDFNGDGKPDLAVTEAFVNNVAIMLNSGGTLQAPVTFSSGGSDPVSIATADFNGDGHADLAVANSGTGVGSGNTANVVVFSGSGTGSFQPTTTLTAGTAPTFVTAVDVNGDGKPDLVVVDSGELGITPGNIYVFRNNGSGGFASGVAYPASAFPSSVTVADVNGDGKPDLVVTTSDVSINYYVAILLGNGDGTFQPAQLNPTAFGGAAAVARDFNGDGKVDLVVSHCCGDTDMTFLPGLGDGTFQPEVHFNGGASPNLLAVADLNGDGKPDLIIQGNQNASITPLLNNALAPAATVNAASYSSNQTVAADSIAAVFGAHLSTQTAVVGPSLGTSLGGSTVTITDSSGYSQLAPLFFVSPGQINFQIPPGLATGTATVEVQSSDGVVSDGPVTIATVSPGIFASGNLALADVIQVVNGTQVYSSSFQVNSAGQLVATPIAISSAGTYLVLYGTGIRAAPLTQVSAQVGSTTIQPLFAGATGQFAGEDQVNLLLPTSLSGSGDTTIVLTAQGVVSNAVHVTIQ